jgi:hypothetical protein
MICKQFHTSELEAQGSQDVTIIVIYKLVKSWQAFNLIERTEPGNSNAWCSGPSRVCGHFAVPAQDPRYNAAANDTVGLWCSSGAASGALRMRCVTSRQQLPPSPSGNINTSSNNRQHHEVLAAASGSAFSLGFTESRDAGPRLRRFIRKHVQAFRITRVKRPETVIMIVVTTDRPPYKVERVVGATVRLR